MTSSQCRPAIECMGRARPPRIIDFTHSAVGIQAPRGHSRSGRVSRRPIVLPSSDWTPTEHIGHPPSPMPHHRNEAVQTSSPRDHDRLDIHRPIDRLDIHGRLNHRHPIGRPVSHEFCPPNMAVQMHAVQCHRVLDTHRLRRPFYRTETAGHTQHGCPKSESGGASLAETASDGNRAISCIVGACPKRGMRDGAPRIRSTERR